jgi:acyl-ACP thioesterase
MRDAGLMRWAQDAAWVHSEQLGFGRDWYAARSLWWVVRCAELNVLGEVAMGETVAVTTSVVGYRRVWARRRTDIVRTTGEPVGTALTDWVITDARGLPTRVPVEFLELFGDIESFEPARISLPPTPVDAVELRFAVRDHEIDPLAHANNAVYVDWFAEAGNAVPGGAEVLARTPRRYGAEYAAPAARGAPVVSRAWLRESGLAYRMTDEAGADLLRATVA